MGLIELFPAQMAFLRISGSPVFKCRKEVDLGS